MAQILPYELDAAKARGQARLEIETLERLERELSDEYTVYHGVHWAHSDEAAAFYGEIDFVVVNRYGRAIAIEQKNGEVTSNGHDLVKAYASGPKPVRAQVTRNLNALRSEFSRRFPNGGRLDIDHLLYLPDCELSGPPPSAIDPERVVDARSRDSLAGRITALFDQRTLPSGPRETMGIVSRAGRSPSVAASALVELLIEGTSGAQASGARRSNPQAGVSDAG